MKRVLIGIPTFNRYEYLPLLLWSIHQQTFQDWKIILIDNNEEKDREDIRENPAIIQILELIDKDYDGTRWEVVFGNSEQGPQWSHQMILNKAKEKYILRVDDDCILDKDCLQALVDVIEEDKNIAAVAPLIFQAPGFEKEAKIFKGAGTCNKIEVDGDILGENAQWMIHDTDMPKNAEHLYSSYLYRVDVAREIGGYNLDLSPVGHREETDFSHRLYRTGNNLLVIPRAVMHHFRAGSGGIRSRQNQGFWKSDDDRWHKRYQHWNKTRQNQIFVNIDGGLGDNITADSMLRGLRRKYPDAEILAGTCYPWMLEGHPCVDRIASLQEKETCEIVYGEFLYKWAMENNFDGNLIDAWCAMVGVENDNCGINFRFNNQYKNEKETSESMPFILLAPFGGNSKKGVPININHPKNWILDRWVQTIDWILSQGIKPIQVGFEETILGAVKYEGNLGKTARLLEDKNCLGFISIDNLMNHLGSIFGRGIVLWTASDVKHFGYEKNINLVGDTLTCHRKHCKPNTRSPWEKYTECSYRACSESITVEMVKEAINRMIKER